jgi:hypothetical protein
MHNRTPKSIPSTNQRGLNYTNELHAPPSFPIISTCTLLLNCNAGYSVTCTAKILNRLQRRGLKRNRRSPKLDFRRADDVVKRQTMLSTRRNKALRQRKSTSMNCFYPIRRSVRRYSTSVFVRNAGGQNFETWHARL